MALARGCSLGEDPAVGSQLAGQKHTCAGAVVPQGRGLDHGCCSYRFQRPGWAHHSQRMSGEHTESLRKGHLVRSWSLKAWLFLTQGVELRSDSMPAPP